VSTIRSTKYNKSQNKRVVVGGCRENEQLKNANRPLRVDRRMGNRSRQKGLPKDTESVEEGEDRHSQVALRINRVDDTDS
jgi:hypothetical protein